MDRGRWRSRPPRRRPPRPSSSATTSFRSSIRGVAWSPATLLQRYLPRLRRRYLMLVARAAGTFALTAFAIALLVATWTGKMSLPDFLAKNDLPVVLRK